MLIGCKDNEKKLETMNEELILVKRGVVQKIADKHNICRQTVSKALNGNTKVLKYNFIRAVAMQNGGKK